MSLTVSQVRSWKPDALRSTQVALTEVVRRVDGQRTSVLREQDDLADSWGGDAANAAAARIVTECSRMGHVAGHLEVLGAAYEAAARMLEAAREHVEFEVSAATSSSFDVNDEGVANAEAAVALLPAGIVNVGELARDLRHAAAEQSVRIAEALRQAAEPQAGSTSPPCSWQSWGSRIHRVDSSRTRRESSPGNPIFRQRRRRRSSPG